MRMPVNEPGPVTAQKKSQSAGRMPALASVSSTASMRRTECCMAQSGSKVTNVSPFLAMTVRYPAEVSMAR